MFSVIVPVHNKLPHLERSITSVLKQTFYDFELLLIDDASTDGSSEKLQEFNDPRIRIFRRNIPGPGGYAARNLGIVKAENDWIAFIDADDEWHPEYLSNFYKAILDNPETMLLSCKWQIQNEENSHLQAETEQAHELIYKMFSLENYLNNPTYIWTGAVVANKKLIKVAGFFPDDNCCKRGGDVDTWIRWLYYNEQNVFLNKTLSYYYRDTINQVTGVPNTYFCAFKTLMKIYETTERQSLKKSIKKFSNEFIYNMIARQLKKGMPIDYKQLKKIFLTPRSITQIAKLHYVRAVNIIK